MAFGSGVLISALSFDLMQEAFESGGFRATAVGFLAGAALYTWANIYISRRGGQHRKRSGDQQQGAREGPGLAIAAALYWTASRNRSSSAQASSPAKA
jgi:zinc transporter, ZIP family